MNDLEERIAIEDLRNKMMFGAFKAKDKGDYTSYLKKIAIARGLNYYLKDVKSLAISNRLLKYFADQHELGNQELRYWEQYGEGKTEFVIWLLKSGKESIKKEILLQKRIKNRHYN